MKSKGAGQHILMLSAGDNFLHNAKVIIECVEMAEATEALCRTD